jgi:NADPH:quinone reductase
VRAAVIREFGGPEVLRLEDVPDPTVASGEALVRVHAVTVNRSLDLLVRRDGTSRGVRLPHVPGVDPVGTVVAVAEDVEGVVLGDRVAVIPNIRCGRCSFCLSGAESRCSDSQHIGVHRWGGYAEYVAVPAKNLVNIPDVIDFVDAAVILRHAPTAMNLLRNLAHLQPGETVLVMGATGGLGAAGVQVAKYLGATVIAGAGADERVALALDSGADHGVNYRDKDLAGEVERITDGRGVDVVFENISDPTTWPGAFASIAYGGRMVTAGAHGGGKVELDVRRLYGRRITLIGGAGSSRDDVARTLEAAVAGHLRAIIDRVLPLSAAAEAHGLFEDGVSLMGKIVLDPTRVGTNV